MKSTWRQEGETPDYRFSLANERTYLAWIRTALGLLAGGMLVDQLGPRYSSQWVFTLAIWLIFTGGLSSVVAYVRWRKNEIAMRHKRPLHQDGALALGCITVCIASMIACVLILP